MIKKRCDWCENQSDEYIKYHDEEWGVPLHDDRKHFEFLVLEGAQAGLSWATILKRRRGYQRAFSGFNVKEVVAYDEQKIRELLKDPGIIKNKAKIYSAVHNAWKFIEIQEEFGSFDAYIWQFVGGKTIINAWKDTSQLPATSKESDALSRDLKSRGFKFVGSKIMYAHMQAAGLVNDHIIDCFRYKEVMI